MGLPGKSPENERRHARRGAIGCDRLDLRVIGYFRLVSSIPLQFRFVLDGGLISRLDIGP
jgi:hypothetical protein